MTEYRSDAEYWLDTRGGRTIEDVDTDERDERGEYVMMGDGNGRHKRVYLPAKYPHEKSTVRT